MSELSSKSGKILRNLREWITLIAAKGKSQGGLNAILLFLQTVGRKTVVNRLYGGIALLLAAIILFLVIGAACISVFLRFPASFVVFYSVGILVLLFVFFRVTIFPLFFMLSRDAVALLVEQKFPSLNNALISSVQLAGDTSRKKELKYSDQMISRLVDSTAEQLKRVDMNQVTGKKFLQSSCLVLIVSALIFSIVCATNRSYVTKKMPLLIGFLARGKCTGETGLPGHQNPAIGDITVSYRHPLYSALPPRTVYNTTGDVKALKGSEVQISAISDRTLLSAGIVLNDSTKIPFSIENGKAMKGTLALIDSGTYVFETVDANGNTFQDATHHTIQVEPDQFPDITIQAPAKDVVVNEKDAIELKYTANDDFGLSEILLVFNRGNEQTAKTLSSFSKKQIQSGGAYLWSLSELDLQPDDKIAYHLEVKDNDTISGPKTGHSKTYYLEIYSSRKKHQELVQLQEALLQELLHILSDDLTRRIDDERCTSKDYLIMTQDGIQERAERIIRLFTDILVGMQEDPMANYSVYYSLENLKNKFRDATEKKREAVRRTVSSVAENILPLPVVNELQKAQDEEVAEVESAVIFLHEIIQKQKLDEVLDTGKQLVQSQNNIEKLLDKLRTGEDAKLNEKVLAELKHLEDTIRQMMEKLMKMSQGEHLDEFLNADAMKNLEQNAIMKDMDAMREAFKKGDLDAALQAAQKLLSSLQSMMDQMKSSAKNLADSSFSSMLNETNQMLDKISNLENKEKELAEKTDTMKKDVQKRASDAAKDTLQSFFEKQEERVAAIKKDLSETSGILAKNELLQEYLQVNRDLKRMAEEREGMASRFSELFDGNEEGELFQKESQKLSELTRRNAELNREINKDPLQKDMLSLSRELAQTEETLSHLEEMIKGWDAKESLGLAKEMAQNLDRWNNRMKNTLDHKKLAQKEMMAGKDREVPDKIEDAARQNQQIVKDLEAIMQYLEDQHRSSLTQEDQKAMQQYAQKQEELQEEAEELRQEADKLSQQNPFMDEKADNHLDMASKSMGGAKEKLSKHDAQGAVIDERESLYRLAEAKKGMEKAKERIEQGMMGGGIPMPGPFRGKAGEGQFGASTEKVEIPSEEAYKVPKEFRQDILDALKEGLPEKYKELNKDYYQRLVD